MTALWTASEEGELRERIDQLGEQAEGYVEVASAYLVNNTPTEARLDAVLELGAGAERSAGGGDASASLVFTAKSERCDLLQVGVSLRGDARTSAPKASASAHQWSSLCLGEGLSLDELMHAGMPGLAVFPLVLRESALIDATPRLTAPRVELGERYSEAGFGFAVEGARYRFSDDRAVSGIGFEADQKWRWRGFPTGDDARVELAGDMWFVRLARRRAPTVLVDRSADIFVIGFHGIQADNGAAIVTFWPVRFSGIGLTSDDRLFLDAELGAGGTGTISSSTTGPGVNNMETINTTGLPQVDAGVAHVALHGGDPRSHASVAYDRTIDTNILADVVTEDRFTASAERTGPTQLVRAAAFVSRARYYLDDDVKVDERIAGASVSASYRLPHDLSIGLTVDGIVGLSERPLALEGHAGARGIRALATLTATRNLWKY